MPDGGPQLTDDQREALDRAVAMLRGAGIDIPGDPFETPPAEAGAGHAAMAIVGRAGSGKTMLLADLYQKLEAAGITLISDGYESRSRKSGSPTAAVVAPTNKAASVLRLRGVPATTIHRVLYSPVYDPEYEKIAQWLVGDGPRPAPGALSEANLDKAREFYARHRSVPAALAAAGVRGSDFITGWEPRDEPVDIGLVDEASMLDAEQFDDLSKTFSALLLFGDPAQLAPVNQPDGMVFDSLPAPARIALSHVHRQDSDNPVLGLAHALADPDLDHDGFERRVAEAAQRDDRVVVAESADSALMARSPMLVWRNVVRIRLIDAFRKAHGAPENALMPGEPLICDGHELPLKQRMKRLDLEARGLIRGAQVIYLGEGRRVGFARVHVTGAEEPRMGVSSIIKIERPGDAEPLIASAAMMGATFLHGAAVTIHKAQGSQWPEVQVYAPDIRAAARSGRIEAGLPLWKRLAYVAITRAETRLHWVVRDRMRRPAEALGVADLKDPKATLKLEG